MKKLFLLFFILLYITNGYSQEIKSARIENPHEVNISVGLILTPYSTDSRIDNSQFNLENTYASALMGTPAINFYYGYSLKKWFKLGATFTFAYAYREFYNNFTNELEEKQNMIYAGILPSVCFTWLNREYIRLYSQVGLGLATYVTKGNNVVRNESVLLSEIVPTVGFTPIGVSVGKKFYGFYEMGLSTAGCFKFGIGYRF